MHAEMNENQRLKIWPRRTNELGPMSTSVGYLTKWAVLCNANCWSATLISRIIWPSCGSVTYSNVSTYKQNPSRRTPRHKQTTLMRSIRCVAALDFCWRSFLDLLGTVWSSGIEFFSQMQSENVKISNVRFWEINGFSFSENLGL